MKAHFLFLTALVVNSSAFAYEISTVKVTGEKDALVSFQSATGPESVPTMQVSGGNVELTFLGADLEPSLNGKLEVTAPHAMIASVSLSSAPNHTVKGRLVLNGKTDGLKNRLSFAKDAHGVQLKLEYPKGEDKTLDMLADEQKPLIFENKNAKFADAGFGGRQILLVVFLLALAGGATAFFFRFLKMKGKWQGSRKYLIEQLGYCPLGAKAGVSLIKVGSEFMLVGVTPNQVTMLSSLPKLEAQYQDESSLERDSFREAVSQEVGRMQKEISI